MVIAPNLYWLVDTGFLPLRYVDARARIGDALVPLRQLPAAVEPRASSAILAPTIALMALALWGAARARRDG